MNRIQDLLLKQLQDEDIRLSGEVRTLRQASTSLRHERESVGVDLYGVQQQLALCVCR